MILRNLIWRQGRRAIAQNSRLSINRTFSSALDTTESSAQNSLKQVPSIGAVSPDSATPIDSQTHATAGSTQLSDSVAEQYYQFKEREKIFGKLGSEISPHYQPHALLTNPPAPADVTLELLLASEAHQGHATSLWNPANARFIDGIRQGIHIISLEATAAHLRRAAKVVQEISRRGGMVLFVGTRPGQERAVVMASELAKGYHLFERWIPGSITNGQQILGRLRTKVVNEKDEEVPGFEEQLIDRQALRPDLVVVLNPLENYVLLHECALNNTPTIGVIDTNADPTWVTYPIPANDDSIRCIQVIAGVLGRAGQAGTKQRLADAEKGIITYPPARGLTLPEDAEAAPPATPESAKDDLSEFTPEEIMAAEAEIRAALQGEQRGEKSFVDTDKMQDVLDETDSHGTAARKLKTSA